MPFPILPHLPHLDTMAQLLAAMPGPAPCLGLSPAFSGCPEKSHSCLAQEELSQISHFIVTWGSPCYIEIKDRGGERWN